MSMGHHIKHAAKPVPAFATFTRQNVNCNHTLNLAVTDAMVIGIVGKFLTEIVARFALYYMVWSNLDTNNEIPVKDNERSQHFPVDAMWPGHMLK